MKVVLLVLVTVLLAAFGTSRHVESECTQAEIDREVLFVSEDHLSGKMYSVVQRVRPGIHTYPHTGTKKPFTSLRMLLQKELGQKESYQRPIMLGENEFWLLSAFDRASLLIEVIDDLNLFDTYGASIKKDFDSKLSVYGRYNETRHDYDSNKLGRVRYFEIENEPAVVLSIHRCTLVHKIYGGVKVVWSNDEYMKVALFTSGRDLDE